VPELYHAGVKVRGQGKRVAADRMHPADPREGPEPGLEGQDAVRADGNDMGCNQLNSVYLLEPHVQLNSARANMHWGTECNFIKVYMNKVHLHCAHT
jgi:hypothetical protein